jgi:hypothetical protein
MIEMKTEVFAEGLSGADAYGFMLNCTDEEYRRWWPGTHVAFHTLKRYLGDIGNLVCFDEYVGRRRLRFKGIVVKAEPGAELVWQMKALVRLPGRLSLRFRDEADGVVIAHTLSAGFQGIGKVLDPFIRLYLTRRFEADLAAHAQTEFTRLRSIL